jgi:hypothetical protein
MLVREPAQICGGLRVAKAASQHEVLLLARLDRKSEKPSGSERAANAGKHSRQVSDVDEHVGGDRKIEIPVLGLQKLDQLTADEFAVNSTLARPISIIRGETSTPVKVPASE